MIPLNLSSPAASIARVGKTVEKQLHRLGIMSVRDLLFYFPVRYDDLSHVTPIKQVRLGQRVVVRGRLELIEGRRSRFRRALLTSALLSDATGAIRIVWFNQPWIAKMFKPGDELYAVGEVKDDGSGILLSSPSYERVGRKEAIHSARIVPVYSATEKLSQKQLRFMVQQVLPLIRAVLDPLPREITTKYKLVPLPQALHDVHFPQNSVRLESARRRLKFDELFRFQLFAATLKQELKKVPAPALAFQEQETKWFVEGLPFKLTDGQRKAAWEIIGDLTGRNYELGIRNQGSVKPMNRLLEGEVGSGKTVVVAIAALNAVLGVHNPPQPSLILREGDRSIPPLKVRGGEEGLRGQVAIMAPTEILAQQHFKTFSKLFEPYGIKVGLRTSVTKRRDSSLSDDVIVGTHALLQKSMHLRNLVLAVVDEQHRFGVSQRAALKEKRDDGLMPHLLTLTATPIPRSLALVFYGDLDISILKEMPKGRQKIETRIVLDAPPLTPPRQGGETKNFPPLAEGRLGGVWTRQQAYDFVRQRVQDGHQVFWTCPIIDPSDILGVAAATEIFEHLKMTVFPDLKVGLLHGRMKSKEREKVMGEFVKKEMDILVATPVIEVGIDVPNATVMVIEGSERFGLAQLHQFRGRVGRGEAQSYCLLMVDEDRSARLQPRPGDAKASHYTTGDRFKAFLECDNGFELAERDLALRGPGEVYGTTQSGFPEFTIATLADVDIAKETKEAAGHFLAQDPELTQYPELKQAVLRQEGQAHLE